MINGPSSSSSARIEPAQDTKNQNFLDNDWADFIKFSSNILAHPKLKKKKKKKIKQGTTQSKHH